MAYERRSFAGGAAGSTLTGGINSSVESFTVDDATNWPSGSGGDFFVVIDRGTASEEKVRCQSLSGTTVTVRSGGRGSDGTTGQTHSASAAVELCMVALDLDEANGHLSGAEDTPHAGVLQPFNDTLTDISGLDATAFGLSLLEAEDAVAAQDLLDISATAPKVATVATAETLASSGSYTDITTPGPAKTVVTGTSALVVITAQMFAGGVQMVANIGVAISGATTVAATDSRSLMFRDDSGGILASAMFLVTGLTPGSNIFTLKYKSTGTVQFANRTIMVTPF